MRILSSSAESICQHEKIKFVSLSGHGMFCLFYRYWWNSYIKHNFFFRPIFLNVLQARKSIDLNIWQLIEKVTGNCIVFAPRSLAYVADAKRGGGREREKSAKEEKRERSASFKSRCFCIPPSIFRTNPTIRDQSQVGRLSAWSELNYFVYRKLSSRDAFFKWYHNRTKY